MTWPDPAGSLTPDPASTADLGELDLPRRVRQASMAPQLRDSATAPGAQQGEAGQPGDSRSPEETRAAVAAIQRGWQRGRSLFDAPERHAGAAPGAGPADGAGVGNGGNAGAHQGDE